MSGPTTSDSGGESAGPRPSPVDPAAAPTGAVPRVVGVLGWYGTLAILGAYLSLSMGWLDRGVSYQLLNLTGASGVALVCWWKRAWQPLWLEVAWAIVAATGLVTTRL